MKQWELIVSVALSLGTLVATATAQEALPPEVLEHGYADMIVANGKIVTMDDRTTNPSPGRIVEALAVKKDKIIALGATSAIRRLAGPKTISVDLKGRTVIPGLIETHAHLYGYAIPRLARKLGLKSPNPGIELAVRVQSNAEATFRAVEKAVVEAVEKVKLGEWMDVRIVDNPDLKLSAREATAWITEGRLSRKTLDRWASNHPVLVRAGVRGVLNSKGLEAAEKVMPGYGDFLPLSLGNPKAKELGLAGSPEMSALTWELWFRGQPWEKLAEMLRQESEAWASYGVTTFSTRIPHPTIMSLYAYLDRTGRMPIRLAAHYETHRTPGARSLVEQQYPRMGAFWGVGSDYLWIDGLASERWDTIYPGACLGRDVEAPPHIKGRELCPERGYIFRTVLENAVKAGWRPAGIHGVGSHGQRLFHEMLEDVMQEMGWNAEDIRRLRPTMEHCEVGGKLPDVIEKHKRYGIILSCGPAFLESGLLWIRDYGPKIEPFIVPLKSLIAAGVRVVGQIDRADPHRVGAFYYLWLAMTRKVGGKVIPPVDERIDRITALKMWTTWASEYVLREGKLGTVEVGRLADFVILDRDYFTIPEDEIPAIKPLMTVVGGRTVFLRKEFALELKMEPVGHQPPADWPHIK